MKNTTPVSIVMADDDLDDQYLVKRAVEENLIAHEFTSVNNGRQLMDLLLRRGTFKGMKFKDPDCILLDLNMPMQNGFDTLVDLKTDQKLRHIPVFVLSTSRSVDDKEKAIFLGATGFFVKPNRYSDLKTIVAEICSQTAASAPQPVAFR